MTRLLPLLCAASSRFLLGAGFACALLIAPSISAQEFRVAFERVSLTARYIHSTQWIDGLEVAGTMRIERIANGRRDVVSERSARREPRSAIVAGATNQQNAFVLVDGLARAAVRRIEYERALEPHARYYDAYTGELLRDDPLFFTVRARVFEVNPVAKLNDVSLRDQNDAAEAVPDAAYSVVEVPVSSSAPPLTNGDARIIDSEAPFTQRADPAALESLNRSMDPFEEASSFHAVTRTQQHLRSIGYTGSRQLVPYSIGIDAHAANGTDNSYFVEGTPIGQGTLFFGDGGTDDAEDSDIVLHEFAHAIHHWIAPGGLTGSQTSEARAIAEGFADYWAFSETYAATVASGRDPFCIADWDARCAGDAAGEACGYPANADCLRRVDSTRTMADYRRTAGAAVEYENAAIWSSALREIFMALTLRHGTTEGKRISDVVIIESLFGMPPSPSLADIGRAMIRAEGATNGGRDRDVVCGALAGRAILGGCVGVLRGERLLFQAPTRHVPIPDDGTELAIPLDVPDIRLIERLAVRVDIQHPVRGDVTLTLVAPDGSRYLLKRSSETDRTPDIHAAFGLDATPAVSLEPLRGMSAAGRWTLLVRDVFPNDVGTFLSWGLQIEFAGSQALIDRPQTTVTQYVPAASARGAAGSEWKTDLDLFNDTASDERVYVLFTPGGTDGRSGFAALEVFVPAGESVALTDVVGQLQIESVGNLAVASSTAGIIVTSRTYLDRASGTVGDAVLPLQRATRRLAVPALVNDADRRSNLGILNTSGSSAEVRIRIYDATTGALLDDDQQVIVLPYGFLQLGVDAAGVLLFAEIEVRQGEVAAYGSVIHRRSDDSVILPAVNTGDSVPALVASYWAPVIDARGASGVWRSEAWRGQAARRAIVDPGSTPRVEVDLPAVPEHQLTSALEFPSAFMFGTVEFRAALQALLIGVVRNGELAEHVPFFVATGPLRAVDLAGQSRDVVGIEVSGRFRANGGLLNPTPDPLAASMTALDAAGNERGRFDVLLAPYDVAQVPLPAGTVRARITAAFGYASVIDNASGDAWFIPAR